MTEPARPWDSGLQIERTSLAWQRTALSTLGFSLLVARLVAIYSWPLAGLIAMLSILAAIAVALTAADRYRRGHRALHRAAALPDARSYGALTVLVLVSGLGGVTYLVASWRS